jgi:hypothetical protein
MINPINQQYLGQRKINAASSNFHHPASYENNGNLIHPFRNQRKKLLQQQKDRFMNKYKDKGIAILESNKSIELIEQVKSDVNLIKEDSLHFEALVSPIKGPFNKTKVLEDGLLDQRIDKRKGLGTVHHIKRKKIHTKEKHNMR